MKAMQERSPRSVPPRRWYLDTLSAAAFFALAFVVGRALRGAPFAALFAFALCGGLGWLFARAAWSGLMGDRQR
jgi:hypothetical protein